MNEGQTHYVGDKCNPPHDKLHIEVDAPGAKAIFEKWLARGDAIGVFTNHAFDSVDFGRKIFLAVNKNTVIGVRAPDHSSYGTGWKYLLDSIETDIECFSFNNEVKGIQNHG